MLQTVEFFGPYQKGNKCYVSYKVKCMEKCIYSVFIYNYLACNSKTVNKKQRGGTGVKEGEKETEVEWPSLSGCKLISLQLMLSHSPQLTFLKASLRNELHEKHQNRWN